MDGSKTDAIVRIAEPTNSSEVRKFIGIVKYHLVNGYPVQLPTEALPGLAQAIQWANHDEYVEQLLRGLQKAFEDTRVGTKEARKRNQATVNQTARLRTFAIGEAVVLNTPQHTQGADKKKLASPWTPPWCRTPTQGSTPAVGRRTSIRTRATARQSKLDVPRHQLK